MVTEGFSVSQLIPNKSDKALETLPELKEYWWCEEPEWPEYILSGVLLTLVGLFGIAGNFLCAVTFIRMRITSAFGYFILGLTCSDLIVIMALQLQIGTRVLSPNYFCSIYPLIRIVTYPLLLMAKTTSFYLTVTVTLERYLAICQPLQTRINRSKSKKHTLWILCLVVAFSIAYNVPRCFEYRLSTSDDPRLFGYEIIPSDFRDNQSYEVIYRRYGYCLVMFIVPSLTLLIFNILIFWEVSKANKKREQLSSAQKVENSLAFMLASVVTVFLICHSPALIFDVTLLVRENIPVIRYVEELALTINCSVNFLIYYISGDTFRKQFKQIYCTCISTQPKMPNDPSNNIKNNALQTGFRPLASSSAGSSTATSGSAFVNVNMSLAGQSKLLQLESCGSSVLTLDTVVSDEMPEAR